MELLEYQRRYAEVLIKIGVQLKRGQSLYVETTVEQSEFVALLAQEAYRSGCDEFGVVWTCPQLERVKLEQGHTTPAPCDRAAAEYYAGQGAAFLRLDCPDASLFADLPAEAIAAQARTAAIPRELFRQKAVGCGQTIACLPCQSWADLVFPALPPCDRMAALWDAVLTAARCKESDPLAAWQKYLEDTVRRKALLDEKHYTAFHYYGGQTDAVLCPAEKDFWKGSCIRTPGRVSVPNIPTEEVFLTPHKYRVNGTLASTMPLNYRGGLIEGIRLVLREGRIVEYSATQGQELLASIIETDEGSHYLGEMAFVDQASPIARLGLVFYTTLYDENAACHVAIGNALGPVRDPAVREAQGMNTSAVHVDFMVGSDELCIDGQLPNGAWEPVFIRGHWAF